MLKRIADILVSAVALIVLSPLLMIISLFVALSSPGGVIYRQVRVGLNNRDFVLYKFRTMRPGSDRAGLLTIGSSDPRITAVGRILRKYKLDELPQLFNVLEGTMSMVGPRPEVRRYVDMYTPDQLRVLSVRPGITDHASLVYYEENDLLALSPDPESTYVNEVMPAKLAINLDYLRGKSLFSDFAVMFLTVARIAGFGRKKKDRLTGR